MIVYKCKMCGGTLEFEQGTTVGVCDSCGTKQTLPKLDDEKKANLYDRANHFRRGNDYDKAMAIYEQILNEDNTDAESYWSLVLCRYGIEYVEDPDSHKRIPTVNRAQMTSIFADEDYKSAIQYADGYQKELYEEEAKAIDEIQKGILAISQKEEPFDVFICYKETDSSGKRTQDSVYANDLYHELTEEGFKVFFSRITLEDKLGTAYEPYIFAALNSAKVMVVIGTKPEYFNAPWVKNEWSRYLALIKKGAKKILIPAYKDMDPYDLPEEFSHLQAQDMAKLGFMQDLLRGIKKIVEDEEPKEAIIKESIVVNDEASVSVSSLLKRVFMFLEDADWEAAEQYCEKVLDRDPENAQAYVGKLMAKLHVCTQEGLANCKKPFDDKKSYQKALRFADDELSRTLKGYVEHIKERNRNAVYNNAVKVMNAAETEEEFKTALGQFKTISGFRDADTLAERCQEGIEACRKDEIYAKAKDFMENETVSNYESAVQAFQSIPGWKDTETLLAASQQKLEELKAKREADLQKAEKQEKRMTKIMIAAGIIVIAVSIFLANLQTIITTNQYNKALDAIEEEDYTTAYKIFVSIGDFKDSIKQKEAIRMDYYNASFDSADVGSSIYFGTYEQDNNDSNGKEDIEWIVLEKEDNKMFIISKYILDGKAYNSRTWEESSLRSWLNETFYNEAFLIIEQERIATTVVPADENPAYNLDSGNATYDKVFVLSTKEVNHYFPSDTEKTCKATSFAGKQGIYSKNNNSYWWLRTPSEDYGENSIISWQGHLYGWNETYVEGVRPALWLRR